MAVQAPISPRIGGREALNRETDARGETTQEAKATSTHHPRVERQGQGGRGSGTGGGALSQRDAANILVALLKVNQRKKARVRDRATPGSDALGYDAREQYQLDTQAFLLSDRMLPDAPEPSGGDRRFGPETFPRDPWQQQIRTQMLRWNLSKDGKELV